MNHLEEGDRLRRLSAIMRFVAQMRDTAVEEELIRALIQAAAVWYDLDARAYRRDVRGRYVLEMWLPGAQVEDDPRKMELNGLLSDGSPAHISSIQELEQLGWHAQQGEILLLPIPESGASRWLIAVAGAVEREVEATLMLVCRSAGAIIDRMTVQRGREVHERLVRRMREAAGPFAARARAMLLDYLAAAGAASGRIAVQPASGSALVLVSQGDEAWVSSPIPGLERGAADVQEGRMAFAFGVGGDAAIVIELLAGPGAPFTVEHGQRARAGAEVLSTWLAGVWTGAAGHLGVRDAEIPAAPPFETAMEGELQRAKRLRLDGGVLVASVPGAGGIADSRAVALVIQTLREELRSSDLLGQLVGGDVAAVLVRTSADGVATAASRVRQRLDALARERQVPPVVVGHALYSSGAFESPGVLVARARREAGLLYS